MPSFQQQLGDYEIIERIAQGGMAQIYKAKTSDPNGIERLVVIKRILPHISSNPEYVDMLIDEAKIAVHFNHGNIAQIYDLGRAGDDYFIVMEYVDGKTLGQIIREFKERGEPIPVDIIAYCLIELCRGLDYMHSRTNAEGKPLGVVHRDISPQNIIVSYSGTVKIIDFGVAKAVEKTTNTESGVLKGKFAYMSPEQAQGNPIDRRSDIFAAGILLWELLTQERLFKRKNNLETVKAVQKAGIQAPSKLRKGLPKALDKIVLKALNRKSNNRYQNASEMAEELSRFLIQHSPDFRPFQVTQFLYRYFGPEPDEEGLPPEMPELAVEKKQKPIPPSPARSEPEEVTEVDFFDRLLGKFKFRRWATITVLILTLGAAGFFIHRFYPGFHQGGLALKVIPQSATVLVDGESLGYPQSDYQVKKPVNKPVRVQAVLEGYQPFERHIQLREDQTHDLSIVLEKILPPFGDIYVESNPPGAAIQLNGLSANRVTPAMIAHLQSGKKYKVGVLLDGYRPAEQEIFVDGEGAEPVRLNLEVDYASLEILSSPPGAHVIMDEQVIGNTPFILRNIRPGEAVDLEISLPGYSPIRQNMAFTAGEKRQLNLQLIPLSQ